VENQTLTFSLTTGILHKLVLTSALFRYIHVLPIEKKKN